MIDMLVDGGDAIKLMPYTIYWKLGRGSGDLIKTNMMPLNFGGNASQSGGIKYRIGDWK